MKKSILQKYEQALLLLAEVLDADYITASYTDAEPKLSKLMDKIKNAVHQN